MQVISDGRTPSPEPNPLQLKTAIEIPGYTILSKLGEGASAVVWLARQESLDRSVAIKILKNQLSEDPQEVEDFINEAKSVAKIKSRNIIQIIDVGRHKDMSYFVMEHVEGITLGRALANEGRLGQKKALSIAAAIATGLDDAWTSGKIIHRDIKPENIMLEKSGTIKIADLGLASIMHKEGGSSIRDGEIAGTPNYMAPEQGFGEGDIDCRSDMYSLGAVLYHMVTGVMPFNGEDNHSVLEAQQSRQLANPRDLNTSLTPGCAQIITKLMMKKSKYRFQDWSTVAKELSKLASGKLVVNKVPSSAVSTIAQAGAIAPSAGANIKIRKPQVSAFIPPSGEKQTRLKKLKKKYSPQRAPRWLRIPLELVLLGWFGLLAYQLIWLPQRQERSTAPAKAAPVLPAMPDFAPTPLIPKDTPERPVKGPEQAPKYVPEEQPKPYGVEPPALDTPPTAEIELSLSSQRDILKTLLSEGPEKALQALQENHPTAKGPQTTEIAKLLANEALTPKAIATILKNTNGKRVTLMLGSYKRYVEIKSVVGLTVKADAFVSGGSVTSKRSVEFQVTQLEPLEQSRLIGPPTRPDRALAKFVLHMNAGDFIGAQTLAEQCGPLADACIAEIEARIKILVE